MTGQIQRPRWLQVLAALGKAACYLILFLGWQLVVSSIYYMVTAAQVIAENPHIDSWQLYEALLAETMEISLVSGLLTLGSVAVLFLLRRRSLRRELWLDPVPGAVLGWCAALAFCLYFLVVLVLSVLPAHWMSNYAEASSSLDQTGIMAVLSTALVAPVVEEVIFRGLIFTRLRRVMPGWLAVALSSAVFGMCHGEFVWFCYAFFLGAVFALLVEKTHSILPGMLMHVVFNGTGQLLSLLGDFEVGVGVLLVMLLLATVGTAFCALRVRKAVGRIPAPFAAAEQTVTVQAEPYPGSRRGTAPTQRSPRAMWDPDSGPNHKFPPERM